MIETVVGYVDQETVWHAGVGDGRIRVMQTNKVPANSKTLIALRSAAEALEGSLIIEHAPSGIKSEVDTWGALPATKLMTGIKQELDPGGLFSPGRF